VNSTKKNQTIWNAKDVVTVKGKMAKPSAKFAGQLWELEGGEDGAHE
jgi:hypothetical protein